MRRTHVVVTKLGSNVTDMSTLQRFVRLQVSDLNHKGMRSVVLAVDIELGHDNRMVCRSTEGADPPLGCREGRRVQGEGLSVRVPCSLGFETSDVRAVTEFGLGVGTDVDVCLSLVEEESFLFFCGLVSQGGLQGRRQRSDPVCFGIGKLTKNILYGGNERPVRNDSQRKELCYALDHP